MKKSRQSRAVGVGLATIAILSIGSFGIAFRAFPDRLKAPFDLLPAGSLNDVSFKGGIVDELLSDTKDTDKDGIPDVQELQVYGTSPFLPDSDSDGINDKEEIDSGHDPNCPKGVDCRSSALPSVKDVTSNEMAQELYDMTTIARIQALGLPGITDADSLRAFLEQGGIPSEVLEQFDDEGLVNLIQESTEDPTAQVGQKEIGQLPMDPTPQQIRELLISGGLDKGVVDSLKDNQLVKVYKDALIDYKNE